MMLARKAQGFTLVELVVIVVVLAIAVAAIIPLWPGKSIELSAQASRLATDIRYTQHLATTRGVRYQLLRVNSTSYRVQSIETTPQVIETVALASGLTLNTFTNNLIAFGTDGTPYTTTTIPGAALSSALAISLTDGSSTVSVTVTPQTGMVAE
jgi:type II secretory pathway pseudopilin PulG